jgi:hypothetical protein
MCYCYHCNCDNTRDESAYSKTHGVEHDGLAIPFGSRAYLPTDTHDITKSTCDAPARIGVVAGYDMDSGYIWSRRYLVWDLSEFEGLPLLATKVVTGTLSTPHSTKQVKLLSANNGEWVFPLKARYDLETMTLEGRENANEQNEIRDGPALAPADFDPDAVPVDAGAMPDDINGANQPSVTRNADLPAEPIIDATKVDAERKQWHLDDLGDRRLPMGSFFDIDGVLKKKDKKREGLPL